MLDKKVFLKGILKLKKKYINFKLDVTDQEQLAFWHEDFQELSDDEYIALIKAYCKENEFGPRSPFSILKIIKDIKSNLNSAEEFANDLLEINRRLGFNYNKNACLEVLKENYGQIGVDVAKQYITRLETLTNAELGIITAQIRESYKIALKRQEYKSDFPALVDNMKHSREFLTDDQKKDCFDKFIGEEKNDEKN